MAEAEQVTSLSDDLAAAWDEFESQEEESTDVESEPEQPAEHTAESGGSGESAEEPDTDVHAESVPGDNEKAVGEPEPQDDKPPVGLSASAREAWKDAPPAIKAEIAKREKDFATGIQKYAESAQRAQQMDRALAPYQQFFAMNGGKPAETINGVLQTASVLQMGSPMQRAQAVANMIQQFGVDINTLDNLLVGKPAPQEVQQQSELDRLLEQRLAPVQNFMKQMEQHQAAQAQQGQQKINQTVQQFANDPKNEFYRDVAGDMADIMEMASNRGREMSLEDAYSRACKLHPEVSKILESRNRVPTPNQRRAASSINGSPAGVAGDPGVGDSIADALNAAWDAVGRA